MPFYEYRCTNCGHTLTKLQSMSAPALTTCPQCNQETLQKLVSASGFDLKGVGVFGRSNNPFASEKSSAPKVPAKSGS